MNACVSCLDSPGDRELLFGAGCSICTVATLVAAVVLLHLAGAYVHAATFGTSVSSAAVSTILSIAKWSGVAAVGGISLVVISEWAERRQQTVAEERR